MAFLFYFVIILVTAASVIFGLDLMTSPLPSTPNVPIGRSAQMTPAAPVTKPAREAKRAADTRALSPIYPAHPAAPKAEAQTAQPETADAAPPSDAAAPSDQRAWTTQPPHQQAPTAPSQNQQAPATQPASDQPAAATPASGPSTAPAVAQSNAHCNVQACAAAYLSFRASDCSYQPYDGARQVCTRAGGAVSAAIRPPRPKTVSAARPLQTSPAAAREARDRDELVEVTRIVRKMTRSEDGDVTVQDSQGRIVIIHPGRARAYGPFDDDDRD